MIIRQYNCTSIRIEQHIKSLLMKIFGLMFLIFLLVASCKSHSISIP